MASYIKTTIINLAYRYEEQGYGLISVSGKDAEKFLQGQLTSDIREITSATHRLSAYCNLKGRIRALLRIFLYNESYYLQCPQTILSNTLNTLWKYARFSKIELNDVSDEWDVIGISIQSIDPRISKEMLFNNILDHNHFKDLLCFPERKAVLPCGQTIIQQGNLVVLALSDPYARFLALGSTHSIEILRKRLSTYTMILSDPKADPDKHNLYYKGTFEDWKLLNIKAGIPEIWPATVEKFLPHSLNLPALKAVSFNKGCYCGQEIIARMEYRASLKKHMYRATIEGNHNIPPGTTLKAHQLAVKDAGAVIMASPVSSRTEMLIETQDMYANLPNSLFISIDNQPLTLIIE